MSGRFLACALRAVLGMAVSPVLYADQQVCETLVAVSHFTAPIDGEQQSAQDAQYSASLDFLKALGQKAQLTIKVEPAQAHQALVEVRSGRVDLIIGVNPAPVKDRRLDYLLPAYEQKIYRLWLRSGELSSIKQWPELAGLRGVRVLQPKYLIAFDLQAQRLHWPVHVVDNLEVAIAQVLEGQADYLLAEQNIMQQLLVKKDLSLEFEFIEPPVTNQGLFLAIAKDSACNSAALRTVLSKALTELTDAQ